MKPPETGSSVAAASGRRALMACGLIAGAAIVFSLSWFELASVDLGYHLAYGRRLLETRTIVDCDPFIFAVSGFRFINANWLGQWAMALADRFGGVAGLIVLRSALIAAAFGGAMWIALRRGAGTATGFVLGLAAFGAYERFDLRPELFSYAFLAAQVGLLIAGPRRTVSAAIAALLIQIVWVNSHSYFLVAPIGTLVWIVAEAIGRLARRSRSDEGLHALRRAGAILAAQLAACLANPWGISGALFPIRTLWFLRSQGVSAGGPGGGTGGPWSAISEFHSPWNYVGYGVNAHTIEAWLVLLLIAAIGAAAALRLGRWGDAAIMGLLAIMSFSMRRNIAMFAIVATPLAVGAIISMLQAWRLRRAAAFVVVMATVVGATWIGWSLWFGRYYFGELRGNRKFGYGWNEAAFPFEACKWCRDHPEVGPKVFADFGSSSNAIPWLPQGWTVYADTNTFAYPPRVLGEIQEISAGAQDYQPLLDSNGVNVVLVGAVSTSKALAERLASDRNWAAVWFDRAFIVFVRRTPALAPVIQTCAVRPEQLNVDQWIASASEHWRNGGWDLAQSAGVPLALGWYDKAAELLERATELEPGYGLGWMNLGTAFGQLAMQAGRRGDGAEAIRRDLVRAKACFERALRSDPADGLAARNLKLAEQGLSSLP